MRRILLLLALLLPSAATAQTLTPSPQGLTAQFSSTCAATTCATWVVGQATSVTVSVTGAGSWTLTWKASSDNGATYFDATLIRLSDRSSVTTVTDTGDGQYAIVNSGITHLQARMTTWASGGANVWAIRGYGSPTALPFSSGSPVPATSGGTGISSYAVGDLLTADTTTTLSKLADVAVGSVLVSGGVGVVPAWSATPSITSLIASTSLQTPLLQSGSGVALIGLGGVTSSFPALKRSSALVAFRLADDSVDAAITAAAGTFSGLVATVGLQGTGTGVSVANVGAGSCGSTAATIAGNQLSGVITVGTVAGTQCRVTFSTAAPVARDCTVTDSTTTIATRATYVSSTTTDFLGAFVAGDLITYVCTVR